MTDEQKYLVESIAKSTKRTMSLLYIQLSLCLYVCVMLAGNGARGYLGAGKDVRLPIIDFPIHYRAFSVIGPWMVVATALCLYFELRRLYGWYRKLGAAKSESSLDWSVVAEPSIFSTLMLDREMKNADRLALSVLVGAVIWLIPIFTVWLFAWEFSALHSFSASLYHALVVAVMTVAAWISGMRSDVWVDGQNKSTRALVYALRGVLALVPVALAMGYACAAARADFTPFTEGRFESFATRVRAPLNLEAERASFETLDRADARKSAAANNDLGAGAGPPRFIGIDLSSSALQSADFRGADLRGVDFSGADLTGAMLEGADLRDAVFTRRRIDIANEPFARWGESLSPEFRQKKMRASSMATRCPNADSDDPGGSNGAERSILVPATLVGARLANAAAMNARFGCAELARATMRRIDLTGSSLNRADLRYAKMREATLRDANLRRADLTCVVLDDADLTGADLVGAKLDRTSLLVRSLAVRGGERPASDCPGAFSPEVDATLTRLLGDADVSNARIDDRALASVVPAWSASPGRVYRLTKKEDCWIATPIKADEPDPCDETTTPDSPR